MRELERIIENTNNRLTADFSLRLDGLKIIAVEITGDEYVLAERETKKELLDWARGFGVGVSLSTYRSKK